MPSNSTFHRQVLACSLLLPVLCTAQDDPADPASAPGVTVTDAGNRIVYTLEYFSSYNVLTARDQLERIPGLQEIFENDNDQRGFGNSGDQVLINGKRLSGKTNDIGSAMDRIQARQVVRIEVIRGTVTGLDVRSQGRVVNVVLDGALVAGVGSWQADFEDYSDSSWGGGGELSYNGDFGALNYLLSLNAGTRKNLEERNELFRTPAAVPFERQIEENDERTGFHEFTTNTSYSLTNGDLLNLNGRYGWEDEDSIEASNRFEVVGGTDTFVNKLFTAGIDESREWELGGDYEHTLQNGNVLTALFVYTHGTSDEADTFRFTPAGRPPVLRELQAENSATSEKILRGTWQWGQTATRNIVSGIELALNEQKQRVRLLEDEDGVLQEVVLFNQDSTVEEERFEAFTTYTWQPGPRLLLEGSVDLEFSDLGQQGSDVTRARDFFFARPRLVVRFDQTDSIQWRSRFERRVDQLDFGDFVASFSGDDNRIGVISAGNPELVPEQAWEYELAWEYRLPDDLGLLSVTGLYSDIRNRISSIPLLVRYEDGEEEIRTATGNIDNGDSLALTLNGSIRMGWLNLRTVLAEGSVTVLESRIHDPFTGVERKFNNANDYKWSLGFRHDTGWKNLSYGVTAGQDGPSGEYDIDYLQREQEEPELSLFAELRPLENFTVQLTIDEALRANSERERMQYEGLRNDGLLERLEFRNGRSGREITLSLRGVF